MTAQMSAHTWAFMEFGIRFIGAKVLIEKEKAKKISVFYHGVPCC